MRHTAHLAILLIFGALASTASLAQTLYKSVGPDGRIVYSDRPPTDGRIEKTMKVENLPASPLPAPTSAYIEQLRKKSASPASTPTASASGAVLYSASWCGYCRQAKAWMASHGITWQEIDIDTDSGKSAFAQAGGGGGIPLIFANGKGVRGFTPAGYDALFAKRP